jgi:hypothetical protein
VHIETWDMAVAGLKAGRMLKVANIKQLEHLLSPHSPRPFKQSVEIHSVEHQPEIGTFGRTKQIDPGFRNSGSH